ncbi:hypothetical protein DRO54_03220 [Candidatus Bathyarchaeota archaeon]|nr:MAG: hypothetical protein DRO54_03220 [Candidatus Bathyarchaeota archaeon]
MKRFSSNVKALSVVVTTLIILVVSVLLATVVVYYAVNVTSTRVQEESLYISKVHVWVNATGGWSEAALMIINVGGRDVLLDKIVVRGQESSWNNVYYWITNNITVSADLNVTRTLLSGATVNLKDSGVFTYGDGIFTQASGDLALKAGYTMVLYIMNPDSISIKDVGVTVGITVFTANAQYYKECNIEAVIS